MMTGFNWRSVFLLQPSMIGDGVSSASGAKHNMHKLAAYQQALKSTLNRTRVIFISSYDFVWHPSCCGSVRCLNTWLPASPRKRPENIEHDPTSVHPRAPRSRVGIDGTDWLLLPADNTCLRLDVPLFPISALESAWAALYLHHYKYKETGFLYMNILIEFWQFSTQRSTDRNISRSVAPRLLHRISV